jgi:hypothetical protein
MADTLFGADLLSNPNITGAPDITMANLDSIELPSISLDTSEPPPPGPKLFPSVNDVGPMQTSDGFHNMNADPFIQATSGTSRRMSEEHSLKEKYELLRKFERLQKLGVPMRKRFTLDSPLDEMKMELEFMRREKAADQTIKQFCDWFITGMSALEWSSQNVTIMKAFGLNLEGLSESAQMNVGDMEEDFEELYDMYGDKMKMHPLVRIPIRTCMMVYMVHLTNQMARKAPIPNIDEVLRTNPAIAHQLAQAAMQQQAHGMKTQMPNLVQPPPPNANPMAGLQNFMSSMIPPPPPQATQNASRAQQPLRAVKVQRPNPQPPMAAVAPPPAPAREMKPSAVNIDDLLRQVHSESNDSKKVKIATTPKKGGGTPKSVVSFKL